MTSAETCSQAALSVSEQEQVLSVFVNESEFDDFMWSQPTVIQCNEEAAGATSHVSGR